MNANFSRALAKVLLSEGGYVNHRADPGGPTNLGVTLGVAKRLGIDVDGDGDTDIIDIKLLKPADAAKVYKHEYWDKVRGDDLPSGVDYAVFDFAVNSGPGRAIRMLQAVLGAGIDGQIGPATLAALKALSPAWVIDNLCDRRLAFLRNLPTWGTFGKGWAKRVAAVRAEAKQLTGSPSTVPPYVPKPSPAPIPPAPAPKPPVGFWGALWGLVKFIFGLLRR